MTLCELLTKLKQENGSTFEIAINRNYDMPTFNFSTLYNTIDEWIDGFMQCDVWWSDCANDDEDGDYDDRHVWEMRLLFSEAELKYETGPYDEPAGQWIDVEF